jgi:hypothetical protein
VRDEMNANAARREAATLAVADEPPPLLHPEMARIYREKISELAKGSRNRHYLQLWSAAS